MSENKRPYFQRWTSTLKVWESVHVEAKSRVSELESKREKLFTALKHFESEALTVDLLVCEEKETLFVIKKWNKRIAELKKEIRKLERAWKKQAESKRLNSDLVTNKRALVETNKQMGDYRDAVKEVEREKGQAEKGICPILHVRCGKLKDHELSSLEKRLQHALKRAATHQEKTERLKIAITNIEKALASYKKDIRNDEHLMASKRKLESYERNVSHLLVKLGKIRASRESAQRAKKQVEVLTAAVKTLDVEISTARFVSYMCGNSGVPSVLIENELQLVESKCNWVLHRLDSSKRIVFRSYKTLGGFEKICPKCGSVSWMKGVCLTCGLKRPHKVKYEPTVIVRDQYGERPFCLESGGAQTLQSFAVRLACALFVGSMRGVQLDMIMLDEVFAHLDAENRQRLLTLIVSKLSSEFNLRQQLIVSHHNDVIHAVENIVEVRKEKSGSIARWL
jgi:DNA repair exonuclease SbcCD ATPase subunit